MPPFCLLPPIPPGLLLVGGPLLDEYLELEASIMREWRSEAEVSSAAPPEVIDQDILTVDQVAKLLRCSVDTVRRIPREELPAYQGPGKWVLYLRADLIQYLRQRQVGADALPLALVREILG